MKQFLDHQKIFLFLLCAVILGVFFSPAINSIATGLLLLNWLIDGNLKEKFIQIRSNKALLAILAIFGIHLLGLLYTSNFTYALKDLRIKLPILLIPIVFATTPKLNEKQFFFFLKFFIMVALASSLYSFYIYMNVLGKEIKELREISTFISHIRLSLLNCIAAFACFYLVYKNWDKKFSIENIFASLIGVWLFIFNGILGARMGILVFFILIALGVFYIVYKKKNWWLRIGLIVFIIALPFISYYGINSVKYRVDEVKREFEVYEKTKNPSDKSIIQRFVYWKIGYELIKKDPLIGVGTGDIADAYKEFYKKDSMGLSEIRQHRAHNQFLTILITFGIIGFSIFMFGLIYPMIKLKKYRDYFYIVFFISFMLSMTMEDTIETQAGVTFYAFFNSLFLFSKPDENII
jgi:O-antigen ligase